MPADLDYVPPYPSGWRNKPSTLTAIVAAALDQMDAGIAAATLRAALSVRFDDAQGLTGPEQAQARMNIHAVATVNDVEPDAFGNVDIGPRGFFYEVESYGELTGVDDSAVLQAAIDASVAGAAIFGPAPVRLRPGVTYRAKQLNPTGAHIIAYNSSIKIPDGGTAHNMFVPTGAWRLEGGDFDGNKGATADPGVTTDGCGVYQSCTSTGWAGAVVIRDATFHDFWWQSTNFDNTDATLHDAVNAPAAAVYLDRVKTLNCAHIGQRFTGIQHVRMVEPFNTGMGSHGMRFFLCRDVVVADGWSCDNPSGHGLTSLYCYDLTIRGGHYDRNGLTSANHNGITIGGDSTSNVNMPGRYCRIQGASATGNGKQGIVEDASVAGLNALLIDADYPAGRTVNDPIPTYNQITDVVCNANGDQGITINSSQYVTIVNAVTDHNVGHGIQVASKNVTIVNHHAWYNGQKPLALQGATNWGDHDVIGTGDYKHNTPDDTITFAGTLGYPCRFGPLLYTRRPVTSATTAKMGETLALDTTAGTFAVTLPEAQYTRPGRIQLKWVAGTVAPTIALTGSDAINVAGGTTPPTFAFLNHGYTLESDPITGIWTIVSDDLPLSKLDLRYGIPALKNRGDNPAAFPGNWPTSGGSLGSGFPAKGDTWFTSSAGSFPLTSSVAGSVALNIGDVIFALQDTPGTDGTHWGIIESATHKDTDGTLATNSDVLYPSQKATKTYVDGRRLDQLAAPTGNVSLASHKLTNVTDPTSAQDAATKNYVDAAVAGVLDLRGNYDASGNAFPSTGGRGAAGAPIKGDLWIISVAGTLGGSAVEVGDSLYAKIDTPGTTAANWEILQANVTYVPENAANKDTDTALAANSDTKYASQKAVKAYIDGRRLDQLAAPTADVSMASHKLTSVTDPASAQDAATKAYVDARRLDQAAAPTTDVSLNMHKLTNVTDPANPQDAVTKAYSDRIDGNNQTGTTYTLVLTDQGKVVELNNASAITLTIPPNSSVNFPVGAVIELFQQGAGQVTVAAGAGVTLRSPGGRTKIFGQYSSASLRQRAADEWCLEGDITT